MNNKFGKNAFLNICLLFIQELFIFVLLFSIMRYCDMNIELYHLYKLDTLFGVIGFTVFFLWITGSFKYAKGLFGVLVGRELPNEKAEKNICFFLKITILVSVVINLIITIVGMISAYHDLQSIHPDVFPDVLSNHMAYLAGTSYYGFAFILFILPIYIRVKQTADHME